MLYILQNVLLPHIMIKLYEAQHRLNKNDFLTEYHTKINRGRYDLFVQGLHYLFMLYKADEFPTPWEAMNHQLQFERVDNFFGDPLKEGSFHIKMHVGPSYFLISDNLYARID